MDTGLGLVDEDGRDSDRGSRQIRDQDIDGDDAM